MSTVMLTLEAKPFNFNQKCASGDFKIDAKSTQSRSSKRVRFEVASSRLEIVLDQFRADFLHVFCCLQNCRSTILAGEREKKPTPACAQIALGSFLAFSWKSKVFGSRLRADLGLISSFVFFILFLIVCFGYVFRFVFYMHLICLNVFLSL